MVIHLCSRAKGGRGQSFGGKLNQGNRLINNNHTWNRMTRWGVVPRRILDLLDFRRTSERSCHRFTRTCRRAVWEAVAACVEHGRAAIREEMQDRATKEQHKPQTRAKVEGNKDRNRWVSTLHNKEKGRQQQLATEARLQQRQALQAKGGATRARSATRATMETNRTRGVFIQVAR